MRGTVAAGEDLGSRAFDGPAGGGLLVVLLRSGDVGRVLRQSADELGTYSHCTVLTRPDPAAQWLTAAAVTCGVPTPCPGELIETTEEGVRLALAVHPALAGCEIVVCSTAIDATMRALLSKRDYALAVIGGTAGFGRARAVRRMVRTASAACSVVVVP